MNHKKSPQTPAGYLRGCKSDYRIIAYSDIKNNAPTNKIKTAFTLRR